MPRLKRQSTLFVATRDGEDVEDHGGVTLRPHHRNDEHYTSSSSSDKKRKSAKQKSSGRKKKQAVAEEESEEESERYQKGSGSKTSSRSSSSSSSSPAPAPTRKAKKRSAKAKRADTPALSRSRKASSRPSRGKGWAATHDVRGASLQRNFVGDAKMLDELRSHDFDEETQHDGRELRTQAHVNYDETTHHLHNTHPHARAKSASGGAIAGQHDYHASGTREGGHSAGATAGVRVVNRLRKYACIVLLLCAAVFLFSVYSLVKSDPDHWFSRR